jgi:hypothetical protein
MGEQVRKQTKTYMTSEEVAAGQARDANNLALMSQYADALIKTGQLIQGALQLDHFALLDWPEILGYIGESGEWAMEAAGFGEDAAREAWRAKP